MRLVYILCVSVQLCKLFILLCLCIRIVMYVIFCVFCVIVSCVLFVCKCVLHYCHQDIGALFDYPNRGFSVLFPQLQGKCQGITRKDGARPALSKLDGKVVCFVCFCLIV
jgi:hypothetical protein